MASRCAGGDEPPVFPGIERIPVAQGREVLAVSVPQGQSRPYSHRSVAYKRVGNVNARLSRDEYNRMLLASLHAERRWENEPAEGWVVADMDGAEIVRTVEEAVRRGRVEDPGTRDPAELLRGLGLLREGRLLRAAVVLFGRDNALELRAPQCLLRVARFRGTDRTEFTDNRQFHGNVFGLLQRAERFLRESLPVAGRVMPGLFERVDDPLYPLFALRQALANAFCHRDYSIGGGSVAVAIYDDRLEVTSSGSLHFGFTPDALMAPHESLPWNPLIARVMYRRGLVEQERDGVARCAQAHGRASHRREVRGDLQLVRGNWDWPSLWGVGGGLSGASCRSDPSSFGLLGAGGLAGLFRGQALDVGVREPEPGGDFLRGRQTVEIDHDKAGHAASGPHAGLHRGARQGGRFGRSTDTHHQALPRHAAQHVAVHHHGDATKHATFVEGACQTPQSVAHGGEKIVLTRRQWSGRHRFSPPCRRPPRIRAGRSRACVRRCAHRAA